MLQSRFLSPAKVNLFFCVLGKYVEGYHEVYSVMTALDFFDTLVIRPSESDSLYCSEKKLKMDSRNLVVKARDLFRKKTSIDKPVCIKLYKTIPLGSGLGGGSSNAATTLWALNKIFNNPLSLDQLKTLAIQLGSDVAFFFSKGLALVKKKGQDVKDISTTFSKQIHLIFNQHIHSCTKSVFSKVENYSNRKKAQSLFENFKNQECVNYNDLLDPALAVYPALFEVYTMLKKAGVDPALSGSGSTFFTYEKSEALLSLKGLLFHSTTPVLRRPSGWY